MIRAFLALTSLAAGAVFWALPVSASADPTSGTMTCDHGHLVGAVTMGCDDGGSQGTPGTQSGGGQGTVASAPVTQWTETRYIPTCGGNEVEGGADALCMAAVSTCPDDAAIRFWVYVRTVYAADQNKEPTQWEMTGTECRGPNAPTQTIPRVTRADVIDAVKALAPKPTFAVQPATQTYVNIPNNYYADAPDVDVPVTVFGLAIDVHFSKATVAWDFGDGSHAEGTGIKDAAVGQSGAIEHAYAENGAYQVRVATAFHVSFDLPDGTHAEDDVQGFPSAPVSLEVGEIQTLVTDAD